MSHCFKLFLFVAVDIVVVIADVLSLIVRFLFRATPSIATTVLAIDLLYSSSNQDTFLAFTTVVTLLVGLLLRWFLVNLFRFDFCPITVHFNLIMIYRVLSGI